MSSYITRALSTPLQDSKRKVVILEGARAVGKTMMVRHQLVPLGYSYTTLADPSVFAAAQADLRGWLESLTLPVAIDEAQRIADLPMAVKEIVDALPSGRTYFLLTGSAIINRTGLDGQDPLARRAQHYTMSPLTGREIHGATESIVDDLWNDEPNTGYESTLRNDDLYTLIAAGGFPEYSTQYEELADWERENLVNDDIRGALGNTILPDEKLDISIAANVLDKMLCTPGGILNTSMLGRELALDRRTVERYISIFMRRFLVYALPNVRTTPNRQTFARAKIHPVDTSFSIQTLLSKGKNAHEDPTAFGAVLESFVVNQIVPATQWSAVHPDCFYWRTPGSNAKEVDLILTRRGRTLGIEVKASSHVERRDFKGLAALAQTPGFHRGYLIYTGSQILKWPGNLWALPVSALWELDAFKHSPVRPQQSSGAVE